MHRAQRMCEARMFSPLVSKMRQAELFYSTETLKFRRVYQARQQLSFFAVRLDPNNVVNRITVYFFRQNRTLLCKEILAKLQENTTLKRGWML
jgi:hypothetical protein